MNFIKVLYIFISNILCEEDFAIANVRSLLVNDFFWGSDEGKNDEKNNFLSISIGLDMAYGNYSTATFSKEECINHYYAGNKNKKSCCLLIDGEIAKILFKVLDSKFKNRVFLKIEYFFSNGDVNSNRTTFKALKALEKPKSKSVDEITLYNDNNGYGFDARLFNTQKILQKFFKNNKALKIGEYSSYLNDEAFKESLKFELKCFKSYSECFENMKKFVENLKYFKLKSTGENQDVDQDKKDDLIFISHDKFSSEFKEAFDAYFGYENSSDYSQEVRNQKKDEGIHIYILLAKKFYDECSSYLLSEISKGNIFLPLAEKLSIKELAEKLSIKELAEKLNITDLAEKLDITDLAEKLNITDLAEKLSIKELAEKLNITDLAEKLSIIDHIEKLIQFNIDSTKNFLKPHSEEKCKEFYDKNAKECFLKKGYLDKFIKRVTEYQDFAVFQFFNESYVKEYFGNLLVNEIQEPEQLIYDKIENAICEFYNLFACLVNFKEGSSGKLAYVSPVLVYDSKCRIVKIFEIKFNHPHKYEKIEAFNSSNTKVPLLVDFDFNIRTIKLKNEKHDVFSIQFKVIKIKDIRSFKVFTTDKLEMEFSLYKFKIY